MLRGGVMSYSLTWITVFLWVSLCVSGSHVTQSEDVQVHISPLSDPSEEEETRALSPPLTPNTCGARRMSRSEDHR